MRFVSSFVSGRLMGKVGAGVVMGAVLPFYVGVRQQERGPIPTWKVKIHG